MASDELADRLEREMIRLRASIAAQKNLIKKSMSDSDKKSMSGSDAIDKATIELRALNIRLNELETRQKDRLGKR